MNVWYRLLLRLHPRDFREQRGREVESFLAAESAEADAEGPPARLRLFLRTSWDLLRSAVRLRLRPVLPLFGASRSEGSTPRSVLGTDVLHAFRALRATPVVTAVIVLTLGIGVGSTTAVFSVVDAALLRSLGYRDADRLVQVVGEVTAAGEEERISQGGGDLSRIRRDVSAFEQVEAVAQIRQNLTGAGLPRQVRVGWTSPGFFPFLGVRPALGRTYDSDDPPGTVVLGHALFVDQFGADADVLGRTVGLDGHPHTIVGVLPADFRLYVGALPSDDFALWKNPDDFWQNGDVWDENFLFGGGGLRILGRLRPGATVEDVDAQLAPVAADIRAASEERGELDYRLSARPLRDELVRDARPTLLLLSAAVLAVLLIACANVMGLLLVRARGRSRELALRRTLGASQGRLLALLLTEGALLAVAGGAVGLVLAALGTGLLSARPALLPLADAVSVDGRVLAFALAVSMSATLLVALVPAWGAVGGDGAGAFRGTRTVAGTGGARDRLRGGLVVGQIAVSLVLLVATGLLTSTLVRLRSVEPGFRADDLLTFSVSLPGTRYDWNSSFPSEAGTFLWRLEERLVELPGVEAAGVMWPIPLSGASWSGLWDGGDITPEERLQADFRVGTPGYFEAMGIPLLDGRLHRPDDARATVVVSRGVAERAWPGSSAVGQTIRTNPWGGEQPFEVIGVVEDVRHADLREDPTPTLYFDTGGFAWTDWEFDVVARAGAGVAPLSLLPAVRETMADLDSEIPVAEAATMASLVDGQMADTRFTLTLVGLFSTFAGVLALVGLYGVVSYAVSRRDREMGIRMALGSERSGITRLVVGQGMSLVVWGLVLGLVGAWGASRLLEQWLYEVQPTDVPTYAAVAMLLAACALVATWIPAARAARTDPARVLRSE